MTIKGEKPFFPLETSSAPSFNSTTLSTATAYALESAVRIWSGPSNRSVRIVGINSSETFYVQFGSSTIVAGSTSGLMVPGSWPSIFHVTPSQSYISIVATGSVTANVTCGYGG